MLNTNEGLRSTVAKNLMYKVYGLMAFALTITAAVAYYIAHQPVLMQKLLSNSWLVFGLFVLQLLLVIILSAAILRLSFAVAVSIFIAYAILMGITFSSIFIMYNIYSIYTVFFVTAGMFAAMALYGYFTKTDLTNVGKYSIMILFGLIIGFLVNMFLKNGAVDYILSLVGVVVFTLLTAYDVQKIKQMGNFLTGQGENENKIAVLGALTLYLDFINLFLMLLRIFGRRNQ
jgi:uncharacterized protein